MSLTFLVPAFLAGLAALAIPVLLHLTRKQTRTAIAFPSLMFIRQVPHRSTSRRTIHRWPLLLLRLLGLALLVFAFSRPFVHRDGAGFLPRATGGRELVILLDRSYSMGFGDRWQRAIDAAEEAIGGLGSSDRGTLLFFDTQAEAGSPTTMERGELLAALRGVEPGPRSTRYAPGLRYAQRILAGSPLPRREVVLISDFQRRGWDADAAEIGSIQLPPGTRVTPVSVAEGEGENLSVAGASIERMNTEGHERAAITARLVSHGEAPTGPVPVVMEVDGRPVETRQVSFSGSSASVTFDPLTLPADRPIRGRVRLAEDDLAVDNTFHFVLAADQRVGALIVEGPGTPPRASFYLERALQQGDSPGFRVETRNVARLSAADLEEFPVMIFNQTALPDGEVGRRLRARVEGGAGLISIAGDNSLGQWDGVIPSLGRTVDHSGEGGTTLGFVDLGHPVFEPFSAPRSGDFTAARVFQYRALPEGARVLARFGDGGAALTEQRVGKGRVLVWSSTMDSRWNNLALQPVFLPFVHQLVKYAAGYSPAAAWQMVGDPFDPGAMDPQAEPYTLALTPGGERLPIDGSRPLALEQPGFYELRDQRTGDRNAVVGVNVDPAEAGMESFDPKELVAAVAGEAVDPLATSDAVPLTLQERERQQSAWWYLLVIAFLILAAESVVSNRFYRGATPTRG
ncbi:MAG TPA: BatA domain-containing protein [Longimicrobiaceae bacterium]